MCLATNLWGSRYTPVLSRCVAHQTAEPSQKKKLEVDLFHDFGKVRILPVLIPAAVNSFMGQTNTVVDNVPLNGLNITWLFPRLLKGKKKIWQLIKSNTAQLLR